MKIFNSDSRSISKYVKHEDAPGVRISPGPYIGVVKNAIDPLRTGRLQVYIAELGGVEDDETSWRTVSYCSPFFGHTDPSRREDSNQDFKHSPHSYGMWFVPPDVGVTVLCTFANGDPYKGFWFGCIPEWPAHHMVPGMANTSWRPGGKDVPVVDHTFKKEDGYSDFYKKQNTEHTIQSEIYKKQGLIDKQGKADKIRGPGISTSFRESPSRVFGISTPGPEITLEDATADLDTGGPSVSTRRGGHMFIMDDGTAEKLPKNQMIKLRTSTGHTIVMNDTAGCIYIINAAGTAWFEMDDSGSIKAFSQNVVTMHADKGFKFETPEAFQITAKSFDLSVSGPIKVTGQTVDLSSKRDLRIGAGQDNNPQYPGSLHLLAKNSTYITSNDAMQIYGGRKLDIEAGLITLNSTRVAKATRPTVATTCIGPTREPYKDHQNVKGNHTDSNSGNGSSGPYGANSGFGERL